MNEGRGGLGNSFCVDDLVLEATNQKSLLDPRPIDSTKRTIRLEKKVSSSSDLKKAEDKYLDVKRRKNTKESNDRKGAKYLYHIVIHV